MTYNYQLYVSFTVNEHDTGGVIDNFFHREPPILGCDNFYYKIRLHSIHVNGHKSLSNLGPILIYSDEILFESHLFPYPNNHPPQLLFFGALNDTNCGLNTYDNELRVLKNPKKINFTVSISKNNILFPLGLSGIINITLTMQSLYDI